MNTEKNNTSGSGRVDSTRDEFPARLQKIQKFVKHLQVTNLKMKKDMEARAKVFEKCKNRINSLEFTIEEKNKRIDELERLNRSVLMLNESIDEKEERLKGLEEEVKLKREELSLIESSVAEFSNEFEVLESNEVFGLSMEDNVESKMEEELYLVEKRVNSRLSDVELREKDLDSRERAIREDREKLDVLESRALEREKGLDSRFHELEHKAKELELKQKMFDSEVKKVKHIAAKDANVALSKSDDQSWIDMDGKSLQLAMNKHVKGIELMNSRMSAALRASPDPAKLVLDAMQGFYPSIVTVDNGELQFNLRVVRKSCILLLKKLKGMPTLINPQVRKEAMQLAVDWKAQMAVATATSCEALGFLRLITTYEIAGMFDSRELRELFYKFAEPALAIEIDRALGINTETPVELRQIESSVEELRLREKTVEEEKQRLDLILKSAEKRGKHLDSLQHLVEERGKDLDLLAHELERKEKELLQQAQDLDLRRRQFDLLMMIEQLVDNSGANNLAIPISSNKGTTIMSSIVNTEQPASSSVARNAATLSSPSDSLLTVSLPSNVTTEQQESLCARNAAVLTSPSSTVQDKPLATLPSSADPAAKDVLATQTLIPKVEPQEEKKRKESSTSSSYPKLPPGKVPKSTFFDSGVSRPWLLPHQR